MRKSGGLGRRDLGGRIEVQAGVGASGQDGRAVPAACQRQLHIALAPGQPDFAQPDVLEYCLFLSGAQSQRIGAARGQRRQGQLPAPGRIGGGFGCDAGGIQPTVHHSTGSRRAPHGHRLALLQYHIVGKDCCRL